MSKGKPDEKLMTIRVPVTLYRQIAAIMAFRGTTVSEWIRRRMIKKVKREIKK